MQTCFYIISIGLADPNALSQAVAAFNACQYLGMPACEVRSSPELGNVS